MEKKINKLVLCLIIFCLTLNFCSISGFAININIFTDITEKDYFYEDVLNMANKDLVKGFSDGTFRPKNNVTKDEALVFLARVSGIDTENVYPNSWKKDILNRMTEIGVISTEDTTFKATRLDIAKYIVKIYKLDLSKAPKDEIFEDTNSAVANLMYYYNIFVGKNTNTGVIFDGSSYITRADLCIVLNRLNQLIESPYIGYMNYGDYIVNKNPTSVEDFLCIFKYMGEYELLTLDIPYSKKILGSLSIGEIKRNMTTAFNIAFSKYPEYFSSLPTMNLTYSVISNNSTDIIIVFSNNAFNENELKGMRKTFDFQCNAIIQELYKDSILIESMSDIEKAQVLFEYIAVNLEYDIEETNEGFTGYGAVVNNTAVCQGYTAMYNKLCRLVGLEVEGVSGKIKNSNIEHMWSKIKLNDEWIYCDTTFSDPLPNQIDFCDFTYFNMTYNDIMIDRIVDEFLIY